MVGVPIILHRAGGGRQVFDPMWGIIYRATQADIPRRTPIILVINDDNEDQEDQEEDDGLSVGLHLSL